MSSDLTTRELTEDFIDNSCIYSAPSSVLPSHRQPLNDDIRCVELLSRVDQGHPHLRLAFLWNIVYKGCGANRALAIRSWLQILEGGERCGDVWLWQDGDEEWMQKNIVDRPSGRFYDVHVHLYPGSLRQATSHLFARDWEDARCALRRRLAQGRSYDHHLYGLPLLRVCVLAWLVLNSAPMRNSERHRGLRYRAHWDIVSLLYLWYAEAHDVFQPGISHLHDLDASRSALRREDHVCLVQLNGINDWVGMMSNIYHRSEFAAFCLDMNNCQGCTLR